MKTAALILFLFVTSGFSGGHQIDYRPKALLREVIKATGIAHPEFVEVALKQGMADSINLHGKFYHIAADAGQHEWYAYIGRVNCCRMGGCGASTTTPAPQGFEYFDYFILFNTGAVVQSVKVYNYAASYGQQICSRGWLTQFNAYSGEHPLIVGKNIDAIAGATISTNSITFDVQDKQAILQNILAIERSSQP